jgi:hypothetical protein
MKPNRSAFALLAIALAGLTTTQAEEGSNYVFKNLRRAWR